MKTYALREKPMKPFALAGWKGRTARDETIGIAREAGLYVAPFTHPVHGYRDEIWANEAFITEAVERLYALAIAKHKRENAEVQDCGSCKKGENK